MKYWFISLSLALILSFNQSEGCTGIKLTAKDGSSVHGRTLEFGITIDTSAVVIPRGYSFTATTPQGAGLSYQSKYATVGTICFNNVAVMDAMNEQGLSVGTFFFPGYAGYTATTSENQNRSLSPIDFPNWIVTQFATINEVKTHLAEIVISPTIIQGWGNQPPPFHYVVYDKSGKSIVIEPRNGHLTVLDNPLGVLTNSPSFGWHMTNLRNFINLTPRNAPPLKIGDLVFSSFGQGSGMVGLPGDFTPPSRFVRAAIFSITATPSKNVEEAVFQTFHILNQFDIPVGIARELSNGVIHTDYTIATVVHNPIDLKYYFRTYEDQTIKLINLNLFDKNAKQIMGISTSGRQPYVDVSRELQVIE